MMTDEIGDLLCERAATHGDYADNAHIMQALKRLFREQAGWLKLSDVQRESLDMIALKIGRILTGNPNERDAWRDLCGYAKLAADRIGDDGGYRLRPSWSISRWPADLSTGQLFTRIAELGDANGPEVANIRNEIARRATADLSCALQDMSPEQLEFAIHAIDNAGKLSPALIDRRTALVAELARRTNHHRCK